MFKRINALILCLIFSLAAAVAATGQAPAEEEVDDDTAFTRDLLLSLDYGSNKLFLGRALTVNQVYLSPCLAYNAPSGFFTSIASYRLVRPAKRWDELDLSAGWAFLLFKKKLELSLSYTRFIYSKESIQLGSIYTNNIELYLRKKFKVIHAKLYADFDFGDDNQEYSFMLDVSSHFRWENVFSEGDELKIKPGFTVSAGTLNFYRLNLTDSVNRLQLKNLPVLLTEERRFNITGLEFSLPVEYNIGRFSFEPAIHYNIPLNQPRRFNAVPVTYFTMSVTYIII